MATTSTISSIQFKRGTKEALDAKLVGESKPLKGEPIAEVNADGTITKFKIGDGVHDYKDLPYMSGGAGGQYFAGAGIDISDANYISMKPEYVDYLDGILYKAPSISTLALYTADGAAIPASSEAGATYTVTKIQHKETNVANIKGKLKWDGTQDVDASATAATVTLASPVTISSSATHYLTGTNSKDAAFSKAFTYTAIRYAYTANTDSETAPTTGTKRTAESSFASTGAELSYTKDSYLYLYTTSSASKVQTNVMGTWTDVAYDNLGTVTLTQENGTTHDYCCYRVGPFLATGKTTYRV